MPEQARPAVKCKLCLVISRLHSRLCLWSEGGGGLVVAPSTVFVSDSHAVSGHGLVAACCTARECKGAASNNECTFTLITVLTQLYVAVVRIGLKACSCVLRAGWQWCPVGDE